ncbi:MAG: GatB/YqeY domain-containing protein [Candidatus Eremiobacteraeota bacterium]|nr:GatB/YqeY domain-containing protein [Candidatus Eremiobacteraeota bacterium]
MTLKERIASELKDAMKAREQVRVDTLRSALSAFSYKKIEAGRELEESDQVDVVRKLVKQRSDSIAEFEKGHRPELAAKEAQERDILAAFLPAQKGPEDIRPAVRAALEALAPGERTQGAAMKALMPKLKGEADGGTIRQVVVEELQALGA